MPVAELPFNRTIEVLEPTRRTSPSKLTPPFNRTIEVLELTLRDGTRKRNTAFNRTIEVLEPDSLAADFVQEGCFQSHHRGIRTAEAEAGSRPGA